MTRSPRELANQKIQLRQQQEKLLKDLLAVVDALDRAAEHWHQAEQAQEQLASAPRAQPWWQRQLQYWWQWLVQPDAEAAEADEPSPTAEVVTSARAGIDLIRESMLTVLSQHQVLPLPAQGQPFDPSRMYALGQQSVPNAAPNTVVQEVVRGYLWQDRVLREAQVIVAAPEKPLSSAPEVSS
ncbi:nucleotide exchange factor GrpE [Romeria aff. gracilis LEGE 07310]|uniref:Protein GrpE n=1 Tax=Vasconcelosia minhoensis LEGE 07310 TaxID=915328 RepID=A0A8J7A5T5_9CYAN|nr:nucleotide exchange factor GrpE [Romeria gracilis]MBE9077042.1 nucleotide exchange factor GrpE [Romeria aff. gracilis LEGE 07310]